MNYVRSIETCIIGEHYIPSPSGRGGRGEGRSAMIAMAIDKVYLLHGELMNNDIHQDAQMPHVLNYHAIRTPHSIVFMPIRIINCYALQRVSRWTST